MLFRLTQVIQQAAEDVSENLWPPSAVRRMREVVERFPETEARTIGPVRLGVIGLELRLAAGDEQVDLTFPILAEDRDAIVDLGQGSAAAGWLHDEPVWRRVWQFCRDWADPETLLGQYVKMLWFELDVQGESGEGSLPAPGIFVRFEPETTATASPGTWRLIVSEVVRALTGQTPPEELVDRFERALLSLPPGAFVQYIGLMLSRGGEAVRFVFAKLDEEDLPGFLAAIEWPGESRSLRRHLGSVTTTTAGDRLHGGASALQVDFTRAGVLPRIGLEYVLDRSGQAEQGIRERPFLEHLVARGLCSPSKLRALLALPGERVEPLADVCLAGHSRQLHHIKLVLDARGLVEAKAYYGRSLVIRRLAARTGAEMQQPAEQQVAAAGVPLPMAEQA